MKICTKCHKSLPIDEFTWLNKSKGYRMAECKSCRQARNKAYYSANAPKLKEARHEYYLNNRDAILAHAKIYHAAKERTEETRKRQTAVVRGWRASNPDRNRAIVHKSRDKMHGSFTTEELEQVKHEQFVGGHIRCFYCGSDVDTNYQIEHVVPVSRGGSNTIDNIVLACPPCNQSKGSKLLSEWEGR